MLVVPSLLPVALSGVSCAAAFVQHSPALMEQHSLALMEQHSPALMEQHSPALMEHAGIRRASGFLAATQVGAGA
jgi:hypothetical protein